MSSDPPEKCPFIDLFVVRDDESTANNGITAKSRWRDCVIWHERGHFRRFFFCWCWPYDKPWAKRFPPPRQTCERQQSRKPLVPGRDPSRNFCMRFRSPCMDAIEPLLWPVRNLPASEVAFALRLFVLTLLFPFSCTIPPFDRKSPDRSQSDTTLVDLDDQTHITQRAPARLCHLLSSILL